MAKTNKKAKKAKKLAQAATDAAVPAGTSEEHDGSTGGAKLGRKAYEAALADLQAELVAMQEWVKASGAKVCDRSGGSAGGPPPVPSGLLPPVPSGLLPPVPSGLSPRP